MPLSNNNIVAELSYAYLHAIATRAGFGCQVPNRHTDSVGVDAEIRVLDEDLADSSAFSNFSVGIQLKATTKPQKLTKRGYSYFLEDVQQYNRLRSRAGPFPTILVVLFLPKKPTAWLKHSEEELVLRKCAYWVSLWDAPESENETGQTIYLPQSNILSVEGLRELMSRLSVLEEIVYGE